MRKASIFKDSRYPISEVLSQMLTANTPATMKKKERRKESKEGRKKLKNGERDLGDQRQKSSAPQGVMGGIRASVFIWLFTINDMELRIEMD